MVTKEAIHNSAFQAFQGFITTRLRLIWSRIHLIPGLPVPHFLSPWTNGPQKFGSHGLMVPNQFGPPGQTVPIQFGPQGQTVLKNLVPLDKWSPTNLVPEFQIITACPPGQREYSSDHLSRGTKLVGDHLSRGTKFLETICPWGQNWLGTVCPEGPINWGPIVGDHMSGDHMCLEPNVSQPLYRRIDKSTYLLTFLEVA